MFKNTAALHPRTVDLSGQRFHRLVVVRFDGYQSVGQFNTAYWWVRCDCGTEKKVQARFLKNGLTKSCGCLQSEQASRINRKPPGVAGFNRLLQNYKNGAKHRGIEWKLSTGQSRELFKGNCVYCGQAPSQISKSVNENSAARDTCTYSAYTYSGIDRVDNTLGYEYGNCVSCCKVCNYAKRDMTHQEFVDWISKAYNHLNLGLEV